MGGSSCFPPLRGSVISKLCRRPKGPGRRKGVRGGTGSHMEDFLSCRGIPGRTPWGLQLVLGGRDFLWEAPWTIQEAHATTPVLRTPGAFCPSRVPVCVCGGGHGSGWAPPGGLGRPRALWTARTGGLLWASWGLCLPGRGLSWGLGGYKGLSGAVGAKRIREAPGSAGTPCPFRRLGGMVPGVGISPVGPRGKALGTVGAG